MDVFHSRTTSSRFGFVRPSVRSSVRPPVRPYVLPPISGSICRSGIRPKQWYTLPGINYHNRFKFPGLDGRIFEA